MINVDEMPQRTVIKVIGMGGGGSNAIDRMMHVGITGIEYIAANTDVQALARSEAPVKIQLGPVLTGGLGAGGQPKTGERAAEESYDALLAALSGADMVFLTAGMGGGTGTGSIPVAARAAREVGALTVAVVTLPFSFEGPARARNAQEGIARLCEHVHTLITVPNERLLKIIPRQMPLDVAFRVADDVLRQGVQGIAELVTRPGLINVDFANIRRLIELSGGAVLAVGQGKGPDKAVQAIRRALSHPMLDASAIAHAAGVLIHFTGGLDMGLYEIQAAAQVVGAEAAPDADIIFGATIDDVMVDRVQAILIATGVGARPINQVLGDRATEAILHRRITPPEPVADAHEYVAAEPASPASMSEEDAFSRWPLDGPERAAPCRDVLEVPAFLRRRLGESPFRSRRTADTDLTA